MFLCIFFVDCSLSSRDRDGPSKYNHGLSPGSLFGLKQLSWTFQTKGKKRIASESVANSGQRIVQGSSGGASDAVCSL